MPIACKKKKKILGHVFVIASQRSGKVKGYGKVGGFLQEKVFSLFGGMPFHVEFLMILQKNVLMRGVGTGGASRGHPP